MFYQIAAMMIWSSAFIAAKFAEAMLDPILLGAISAAHRCHHLAAHRHPNVSQAAQKRMETADLLIFWNYIAVLILQFKDCNTPPRPAH